MRVPWECGHVPVGNAAVQMLRFFFAPPDWRAWGEAALTPGTIKVVHEDASAHLRMVNFVMHCTWPWGCL